jgi:uncharacterized membrane protein
MMTMRSLRTIEIVTIGVCGALYAAFGYMTHLGIFTPMIGVVRFWPSVVIPGVFSILFGPIVGGLGAAVGIFISDMVIHSDALLSLTVGVPSNFLGFYLMGLIGRRESDAKTLIAGLASGVIFSLVSVILYVFYPGYFGAPTSLFFVGLSIACIILTLVLFFIIPSWRSVNMASVIGLGVGSIWIGLGVWVYSKFFLLPTGEIDLSIFAAIGWFIWTYFTEIPFLILLVPPILKACYSAFPSLMSRREE